MTATWPRSSMRSIPSPLSWGELAPPRGSRTRFPLPAHPIFSYTPSAPWWWWQAQPSDLLARRPPL
jgi:hypothetical protein